MDQPTEKMQQFIAADIRPPDQKTIENLRRFARRQGVDFDSEIAPRLFDHPGQMFINNIYQVIREDVGPMIHLSIKRIDGRPLRSWKHLQQIKNELIGAENEGVELFPSEQRLVDTANQYHLWVAADPTYRFPFGFDDGPVTN